MTRQEQVELAQKVIDGHLLDDCPDYWPDTEAWAREIVELIGSPLDEWRAVFEYPGSLATDGFATQGTGPWRSTEAEARGDRPWRPEESHGRMVRLERRAVGYAVGLPL